jgi:hypothetical protein
MPTLVAKFAMATPAIACVNLHPTKLRQSFKQPSQGFGEVLTILGA